MMNSSSNGSWMIFFNASDSCPSMKSSFCLLSDALPSTQSDTNGCFFEPPRFSFRLDFESRALVECPAPLGRRRLVEAVARAKMAWVCEPTVGPMEMLGMLAVSSPGCVSEDAEEAGESGSMGEFMTNAWMDVECTQPGGVEPAAAPRLHPSLPILPFPSQLLVLNHPHDLHDILNALPPAPQRTHSAAL